jgi:hypothetical protein
MLQKLGEMHGGVHIPHLVVIDIVTEDIELE